MAEKVVQRKGRPVVEIMKAMAAGEELSPDERAEVERLSSLAKRGSARAAKAAAEAALAAELAARPPMVIELSPASVRALEQAVERAVTAAIQAAKPGPTEARRRSGVVPSEERAPTRSAR